jgi:hypothetical protein
VVAIALGAIPAAAKCVFTEPESVALIAIRECSDGVRSGLQRLGSPGLEWVADYVEAALEEQPGVVLAGETVHRVFVEGGDGPDPLVTGTSDERKVGEWFLSTQEDDACRDFSRGSEVRVYLPHVCCDVLPPSDPACVLDIGLATGLSTELRAVLGSE